MIKNNIGKFLERLEMKQYVLANKCKVAAPIMSQFVNGVALPEPYQLKLMCEAFDCKPSDLYPIKIIDAVYDDQGDLQDLPQEKRVRKYNRVRIEYELYEMLKEDADEQCIPVNRYVNRILMRHYGRKEKCNDVD